MMWAFLCVCVSMYVYVCPYEVVYGALYVEFCTWPKGEYRVILTNQHLSHGKCSTCF